LDSPWDEQQKIIENLAKKVTIYIAFYRTDSLEIAKQIAKKLQEFDYKVIFFEDTITMGSNWVNHVENAIVKASKNGFVLALLSARSLREPSMVRDEILFTFSQSETVNIIPIRVLPFGSQNILFPISGNLGLDVTQDTLENNMKRLIIEYKNKRFQ